MELCQERITSLSLDPQNATQIYTRGRWISARCQDGAEHVDLGAQMDNVVHGFAEQRGVVHGGVPSWYHLPERHCPPPHQPPRDVAARRGGVAPDRPLRVDAPPRYPPLAARALPHLARAAGAVAGAGRSGGGQDGLGPPRAPAGCGGCAAAHRRHGDVGGALDGALPLLEAHGVEGARRLLRARTEAQEQVPEQVLLEGRHGAAAFACAAASGVVRASHVGVSCLCLS